jgi:hypothetical protein
MISATEVDERVALINLQFLQWPREPEAEPPRKDGAER